MTTTTHRGSIILAMLVLALGYLTMSAFFGYSFTQGPNNRNVSVDTTVNITDSLPEVLNVTISPITAPANISLIAGTSKTIFCNATVRNWKGAGTITSVNATFYYNATSNTSASDDNNTHYTNASCNVTGMPSFGTYGELKNISCSFPIMYYANVGIWICNITAADNKTFNVSVQNVSRSNSTFANIDAFFALNVTPLIDFGNLSVGDTSDPQQANVTNLGNTNINVSIRGFTNTSYLPNGLGLLCDIGNISVQNEKYSLVSTGPYTNLSNLSVQIPGLTVAQQTNDSQQVINTTYWTLYVPPNPFGRCNGTIVFQAEKSN